LNVQDHYSIRVTVENPDSFPRTNNHKMSVAFLGSLDSDAFLFQWFYKENPTAPWQAFDQNLKIESEIETKLPAVRISSKRFLGDPLEYVKVVILDSRTLPPTALAEIEQLITCDNVETPMPSQGRCIQKRPVGVRVPLK
jgi:hypothetical protein